MNTKAAQEIAERLTKLIGYDVLLANEQAVIVGSNDTERVGTRHGPSAEVIERETSTVQGSSTLLRTVDRAKNARPGITLALTLEGEVAGTVAITGDPDVVDKFGLVIKSQTEIMLQQATLLRAAHLKDNAVQHLPHDVANFDPALLDPDALVARSEELGYDLNLKRVAITVDVPQLARIPESQEPNSNGFRPELQLTHLLAEILRTTREVFNDAQDLIASTGIERIAILHRLGPKDHAADKSEIRSKCKQLATRVERCNGVDCKIGIGTVAESLSDIRWSYYDAWNAVHLGKRFGDSSKLFDIEEFRIYELLLTTSRGSRERFLDEALEGLHNRTDWEDLRETVLVWCEAGYNVVKASNDLFIHRNTLQHRLDKLSKLSGKNIRDHKQALTLYLACLLDTVGNE